MLRPWVKNMLMAGLLTVAVWMLFIFYWRANVHMPTTSDVFVSLILMPVGLLLSVYLVRKVAVPLITPGASTSKTEEVAAANTNGNEETSLSEREWTLPIIGGSVITMHGNSVSDLAEVMTSKKAKFELDPDLVDVDGYPILSARIPDLDENEIFGQFEQWNKEHGEAGHVWESEDRRSIALAHSVFSNLSGELLARVETSQVEVESENVTNQQHWPVVNLLTLWPSHWTEAQKKSVSHWLANLLSEYGWPSEKVVLDSLNTTPLQNAIPLLDRLNVQKHRQNIPGLDIVIAAQSCIGEKTVEDWLASGTLQTAQNKNGLIPGEAAAGLVLSDAEFASKISSSPWVQLHRASQRKRDKSADDSGKIKADVLVETIKDALTVAKLNADEIAGISADTDARARRVGELMEAINEVMPDFDLDDACLRVGADCGFIGAASELTTLVLGWHQSSQHEKPVLCLSNNDSFERTALVINMKPETSSQANPV